MASVATVDTPNRRSAWSRKYLPMLSLLIAVFIALVVLPSSLNLPQSNPATTLELAPVPPQDDDPPPPPVGNVASFGLGQSSSIQGTEPDQAPAPPPAADATINGAVQAAPGKGKTSRTKNCVGNPPRQTEDPLSPPCVGDFEGDNGGATYVGVTADEVRIVLYYDTFVSTSSPRGTDTTPYDTIIDVDQAPQNDDIGIIIAARAWQSYFNNRYQTYGRRVHFFIQTGSYAPSSRTSDSTDAASRQADAAKAYAQVKPFATIDVTSFDGNSEFYIKYMAEKGVLNFGSVVGREDEFFLQFPKLLWGYTPTIQQVVTYYSNFVCAKVAPFPVSFSPSFPDGTPRKYGLVYTNDTGYKSTERLAKLVEARIKEQCGVTIAERATYDHNGYTVDTSRTPQYAVDGMLKMQDADVTTILWPSGTETKFSAAATQLGYFPEWIIGADLIQETTQAAQAQDQRNWANAFIVPYIPKTPVLQKQLCYQAFREVDATAADLDVGNYGCKTYNDLRQLFTGIQVAGPKLGPSSIDKGYHAIPAVRSNDPLVPACFYRPGDYSCVKDYMIEWWDPAGRSETNSNPGCWRMVLGGERYLDNQAPEGNVDAQKDPSKDECNNFDQESSINTGTPEDI